MKFQFSERLENLPPYVFSEINRIKAEAEKRGVHLMSLGIGDPDLPTPIPIVERIREAATCPSNHAYSPYEGTLELRVAIRNWFKKRFSVNLNPESDVMALIGSKEGIAHLPWAICDPGDRVLFPSPGYPIFMNSILMAGGIPVPVPLRSENGFLPDLKELETLIQKHRPRLLFLNFPSNPTTATCSKHLLTQIVSIVKQYGVYLAYDNAYSEIYFGDENRPPSILEISEARDCAIEFHSLSKSFNMTGWRLGYAVGNSKILSALLRVKTNVDSGPLLSVQQGGIFALEHSDELIPQVIQPYIERRKLLVKELERLHIEFFSPRATFFVWAKVPGGRSSMAFCKTLIESQGLIVTPGIGFGSEGESFFRLALTVSSEKISEAMKRLEAHLGTL